MATEPETHWYVVPPGSQSLESVPETSLSELLQIHGRYDVREEGDDARAVKLLHEKLHVPDKTNWQIHFQKIDTIGNVKLPVATIKDFR